MLSLEPVIRMGTGALPFSWAARDAARDWISLSAKTGDDDIARIIAILAAENDCAAGATIAEACAWLGEASPFVAEGGLIIRRGDFEREPQCCAELSDWRGWIGLKPGAFTPWWGHGPAGWIHTREDAAVIYEDGGDQNDPLLVAEGVAHVVVPYPELDAAVAAAADDVAGFRSRLADWLAVHAPANTTFAHRFDEAHLAPWAPDPG